MEKDAVVVFAKNIRNLRIERGYSQESLAHRADVDRTYIGSIERAERNLTLRSAEKISRAFGLELWEVLSLAETN